MYAVSQLWLDALRSGGGTWYGYVEAWLGGSRITLADGTTHLPLIVDGQNEVRVDGSTPGVRRAASISLPRQDELWDALAPVGTELRAYTGIEYLSGGTEVVPQGVFVVDVQSMGYGPGGDLKITAPDRWVRVQRAEFLAPRQFTAGTLVTSLIASLIEEAIPGVSVSNESTSTDTLPTDQTEDRDRAGLIQKLATAASLDVFFDRSGTPTIRDVPTLQDVGVWDVDAGASGVMVSADRQRDRQRTFNLVVVIDTRSDVTPLRPMYVWDNNPLSPTFAGSGSGASTTPPAAGTAGPFGQRAVFIESALFTNAAQQIAAGSTTLGKVSGRAAQFSLASVPNTALDDGDTILVRLPSGQGFSPSTGGGGGTGTPGSGFGTQPFGTSPFGVGVPATSGDSSPIVVAAAGVAERHIVDSMSVPLVWHRSPLQISTRSTVADLGG